MGLFKSKHEQVQAGTVNPSTSEAESRNPLRRLLGKKRRQARGSSHDQEDRSEDGLVSQVSGSRPVSNYENYDEPPAIQSLWDRAYNALREKDGKLVDEYEELLSKEAQGTISAPGDESCEPPDDVSRGTDRRHRQARLDAIIVQGLRRVENKKAKYTIAGHEFVPRDQIAQAADLVLWAKSWIGEAVKQSPEASIAWAGVCTILPLLTNPVVAEEANRDGFIYVTTRMRYYAKLEPLLKQLSKNPNGFHDIMAEAEIQIVVLYQRILEFQIRSVLRFYQNCLRRYASDVLLMKNWEQMKCEIQLLEATVNGNLGQINDFATRRELESLNNTSEEALETVEQLLHVSEQQLRVAEAQLDIEKRRLEMQEDDVKQKLSDKQNKVLQLFRLTSSNKDVTYEWYKDRVEDRVDGTCEWFLNQDNFKRWLEQDSGALLVSADPGCGKSVLAKYLVDHGLPRSPTICYFFFKDQDQNTCRQVLCALLHQLFLLKPVLIQHATKQYDTDGDGLINSTKSLWTVLGNVVQDPQVGPLIIVLDALDECAESDFEDLVRNIKNQFHNNQSSCFKLKYLLTARPYEQIVSKFQHPLDGFPYVRIPGEDKSEDISKEVNYVIRCRAERLADEKGLTDEVKDHLEQKLLGIPHRTYLWVYLVFDFLAKEVFKKTTGGIDSILKTMPKNVYQAYEQILDKSKDHQTVQKALKIILAASRPLTISEMNVALNMDVTLKSIHDLDLEQNKDFKERLRSCCGLFVSIHHGKVYFLHQTAREFLLALPSPANATTPSREHWQHSITNRDAHNVLAEICVVYLDLLNPNDISDSSLTDDNDKADQFPHPYVLLGYSANNWGAHFCEACVSDEADIIPSTLRICNPDSRSYLTWFRIYRRNTYGCPKPVTSLLTSSYFGHEAVVRLLLEKGADLEAKDKKHGKTPLSLASEYGHEAVVRLLLKKGADLEAKDKKYSETPLSWASRSGYEAVVKLLLEKGADLEAKSKRYGKTPLSWASEYGDEAVIRLLLEKGADLEAKDKEYGQTPLYIASKDGYEAAVRLLLEKGADLEAKSKRYGKTPLSIASENGHEAVVRLLLEKGADFEAENKYGQTPLSIASENGHEAVVRLLLENGADFEAEDNNGQTPLSIASKDGHEAVIRLLLEKGADFEAEDEDGQTLLCWASKNGHEAVVRLLLEKNAELEAREKDGRTPLCWASRNGHEAIVKLLLEKGASPKSQDRTGWGPLWYAKGYKHTAVLELLQSKEYGQHEVSGDSGDSSISGEG